MVLFVTEKYERRKVSLWFFSFRVLFACPKRTKRRKRGKYWLPSRRRRHTCFAYVSIPLLNSFCRLAATGANKVPRPSRYSLTTATGSKRSSADSDSLLCHVRLRRTSRFKLGCGTGCEHRERGKTAPSDVEWINAQSAAWHPRGGQFSNTKICCGINAAKKNGWGRSFLNYKLNYYSAARSMLLLYSMSCSGDTPKRI